MNGESASVNKVGADELREVRTSIPDKVLVGEANELLRYKINLPRAPRFSVLLFARTSSAAPLLIFPCIV